LSSAIARVWGFLPDRANGTGAAFGRDLRSAGTCDAHLSADRARLDEGPQGRAAQAARYFAAQAVNWDKVRALHIRRKGSRGGDPRSLGTDPIQTLLDLARHRPDARIWGRSTRAAGIDQSPQMLSVAATV